MSMDEQILSEVANRYSEQQFMKADDIVSDLQEAYGSWTPEFEALGEVSKLLRDICNAM